jgi:hypothetical protein
MAQHWTSMTSWQWVKISVARKVQAAMKQKAGFVFYVFSDVDDFFV